MNIIYSRHVGCFTMMMMMMMMLVIMHNSTLLTLVWSCTVYSPHRPHTRTVAPTLTKKKARCKADSTVSVVSLCPRTAHNSGPRHVECTPHGHGLLGVVRIDSASCLSRIVTTLWELVRAAVAKYSDYDHAWSEMLGGVVPGRLLGSVV